MLGASLLVLAGLALVYAAKLQTLDSAEPRLNLNSVRSSEDLLPVLELFFPNEDERRAASSRTFEFLEAHRPLQNVGALARLRPDRRNPPVLPVGRLKPLLVVRTAREFRIQMALWSAIYFAAFYFVVLVWRFGNFRADTGILPVLHLLTGIGLILMVSLRDPLRDSLEFKRFAWGVAGGCLLLLLPLLRAFQPRHFANWCYTPLFAAFGLFALLLRFGSGPGESDSKVNLGPFQPVELIKILIVLFLAGYFANKWDSLRDLREKKIVPFRWMRIPRLAHLLPVFCATLGALAMFFLLKDLGPALVTYFLFLSMFVSARGRAGLGVLGIVLLVAGVTIGYRMHTPHTVVDRIDMWLSPWDNDVHGGNQLAHSFWALSTGGLWGSGPGWGDPGMIPAGNTDLVLPSIGEEWGFFGVASVFLLFGYLAHRSLRIALRAATEYGFFLGVGLTALIAFEMLLISGGVLGAVPLSGVVSPFLSSGNSAMFANFLIFALVLAISTQHGEPKTTELFRRPLFYLEGALGICAVALLITAAHYQVFHDRDYLARETRVFENDGVKRAQRNPRLNSIAREIPRGNIFDRNGVLLATSSWDELERRRAQYAELGIDLTTACSRLNNRHYPFGNLTAQFLGDWRTGENFHATNASLVEHDSNVKLQGYRDIRELIPILRTRHEPGNPVLERVRERDRDVHTSIDIRMQIRAEKILEDRLAKAHKQGGALVVMNAQTGDVLALVSQAAPGEQALDRARYGQYPPGSTFKLVTAIAALRLDPHATAQAYTCQRLRDGRTGAVIKGWNRPIRDDIKDRAHGTLRLEQAIVVSCNAYFAQLGVHNVGAQALRETAEMLGLSAGELPELKKMLPFAAFGQGPILTTPLKMARVAATISDAGKMPEGRWVIDESNTRNDPPLTILSPESAAFMADAMRKVVTSGTGRRAMAGTAIEVAGKTGTAQLGAGEPHSWFAGFAPYDAAPAQRIAFAVVVEHGGYGGTTAAPIARDLTQAARELHIIP